MPARSRCCGRPRKRPVSFAFGYAKSRDEIRQVLEAEVDVDLRQFWLECGRLAGGGQSFTIEEAADRARRIIHQIRQVRPETICLVEGGPIVNPDDMYRVCRDAKSDGYVGGSTLDRLPLELSVMQVTPASRPSACCARPIRR